MSSQPFEFRRSWLFDVSASQLWDVLSRTEDFTGWWGWLRSFDAPDLAEGVTAACVIGPPLPYVLRLEVTVIEVVPERRISTTVDGDLSGPACLDIRPVDPGRCEATLDWRLDLQRPMLRNVARFARPVLEWGHEWVVRSGVSQFEERALRIAPGTPS